MIRRAKPEQARGVTMARERLAGMAPEERGQISSERLVRSFGILPQQADQLLKAFRRI